jgi:hypothetical protein
MPRPGINSGPIRSSQLKLTHMPTRSPFQLVLTSFSFEPEIGLKALVQCLLPLVQDLSLEIQALCGRGIRQLLLGSLMQSLPECYAPTKPMLSARVLC